MSWETESGLLESYEGTIDEAWFATDERYRDGEVPLLHIRIANLTSEVDEITTDELVEKFSVGNGWIVVDGGKAVEREDGNTKRKFHKNSKYGMVIDRVVKNKGGAFDGLLEVLGQRGDPKEAAVWAGLRFEFERVTYDYGGEIGERDFILPSAYLGEEAASNGAARVESADVEAILKQLASDTDSYEAFVGKAMKVPGVTDSDGLLEKIADPDYFAALSN